MNQFANALGKKFIEKKDEVRIRSFELGGHTFKVKVPLTSEYESMLERVKQADEVDIEKYYEQLTKEFVANKESFTEELGIKFEPMGSLHTCHYVYLLQEFLKINGIKYLFFNFFLIKSISSALGRLLLLINPIYIIGRFEKLSVETIGSLAPSGKSDLFFMIKSRTWFIAWLIGILSAIVNVILLSPNSLSARIEIIPSTCENISSKGLVVYFSINSGLTFGLIIEI